MASAQSTKRKHDEDNAETHKRSAPKQFKFEPGPGGSATSEERHKLAHGATPEDLASWKHKLEVFSHKYERKQRLVGNPKYRPMKQKVRLDTIACYKELVQLYHKYHDTNTPAAREVTTPASAHGMPQVGITSNDQQAHGPGGQGLHHVRVSLNTTAADDIGGTKSDDEVQRLSPPKGPKAWLASLSEEQRTALKKSVGAEQSRDLTASQIATYNMVPVTILPRSNPLLSRPSSTPKAGCGNYSILASGLGDPPSEDISTAHMHPHRRMRLAPSSIDPCLRTGQLQVHDYRRSAPNKDDNVYIHKHTMECVLGHEQQRLRQIERETNTKIIFLRDNDDTTTWRSYRIHGDPDAIRKAKQIITVIIEGGKEAQQEQERLDGAATRYEASENWGKHLQAPLPVKPQTKPVVQVMKIPIITPSERRAPIVIKMPPAPPAPPFTSPARNPRTPELLASRRVSQDISLQPGDTAKGTVSTSSAAKSSTSVDIENAGSTTFDPAHIEQDRASTSASDEAQASSASSLDTSNDTAVPLPDLTRPFQLPAGATLIKIEDDIDEPPADVPLSIAGASRARLHDLVPDDGKISLLEFEQLMAKRDAEDSHKNFQIKVLKYLLHYVAVDDTEIDRMMLGAGMNGIWDVKALGILGKSRRGNKTNGQRLVLRRRSSGKRT